MSSSDKHHLKLHVPKHMVAEHRKGVTFDSKEGAEQKDNGRGNKERKKRTPVLGVEPRAREGESRMLTATPYWMIVGIAQTNCPLRVQAGRGVEYACLSTCTVLPGVRQLVTSSPQRLKPQLHFRLSIFTASMLSVRSISAYYNYLRCLWSERRDWGNGSQGNMLASRSRPYHSTAGLKRHGPSRDLHVGIP